MIDKIRRGKFADGMVDMGEDEFIEVHTPGMIHPMQDYWPKCKFVKKLHERKRILKYIRAIEKGWLKVKTNEEM